MLRLLALFFLLVPARAGALELRVPDAALCWPAAECTAAELESGFRRSVAQLAVAVAVECRRGDLECGRRVVSVVLTRRAAASRDGIEISIREILGTRRQFSGLEGSALLRRPLELSERTEEFREVAAAGINGELEGMPHSTHYARCETMPKTAWGRAAMRHQRIEKTTDGHCWVQAVLPFPLPPIAWQKLESLAVSPLRGGLNLKNDTAFL